jgi:hypothetical protein
MCYGALQGAPNLLAYEGRLYNAQGVVVPDGSYNVTFRLYDVETALPAQAIWWQPKSVYVWKGVFHVLLGDAGASAPLDSLAWAANKTYWLGVQIEGDPAEMTPRQRIVSVPFSMKAADATTLAGHPVMDPASPQPNDIARLDATGKIAGSLLTTGSVPGQALADAAVTTAKVADNVITTAKIQDGAVTQAKGPELVRLYGRTPVGLGPNGTLPPVPPAESGMFLIQAGTNDVNLDSNSLARIYFPKPFPNGVLSIVCMNGDYGDGIPPAYCSIAFSTSMGQVTKEFFCVLMHYGKDLLPGWHMRVNWIAVGW